MGPVWRGFTVGDDAARTHLQNQHLASGALVELERERPQVCVIDSVQTLYTAGLGSAPGSVAQVRECAAHLTRMAKALGVTVD